MLRSDDRSRNLLGIALAFGVGGLAALLVALGNPGNMGLCGVCFLNELGGAISLHSGAAIFRPEIAGVVLGALALRFATGRFQARSGGHAVARFLLGVLMSVAALVFLACPFRTLQRLGGGDLNAWAALPGFAAGVGVGLLFERRGYSVGRTSPAPAAVGLLGPLVVLAFLGAFLAGGLLRGPGPGDAGGRPHAVWYASLGIALVAGAALSATSFCAVTAFRQVFLRKKTMLVAAAALVAAYAAASLVTGRFSLSWSAPFAHSDWLWNFLALALLGLAAALAGGCPVRQIVMTGEGNGDAFLTVGGMVVGGALATAWGVVSAPAAATSAGGSTAAGRVAVLVGLAAALLYGFVVSRYRAPAEPLAPAPGAGAAVPERSPLTPAPGRR